MTAAQGCCEAGPQRQTLAGKAVTAPSEALQAVTGPSAAANTWHAWLDSTANKFLKRCRTSSLIVLRYLIVEVVLPLQRNKNRPRITKDTSVGYIWIMSNQR